MKIELWSIGSPSPAHLREVETEYLKRLKPMANVAFHIIRNSKVRSTDPAVIRKEEGALIQRQLRNRKARLILLDENGKEFSSKGFSKFLRDHMNHRNMDLVFVIGGAYGFDAAIHETADLKISLSKLTFPHQLVRSIFLEQLYRGYTILNSLPYHHQ
jgi:23S rRNA (pseudouridine1915-N3)-methyltransferase